MVMKAPSKQDRHNESLVGIYFRRSLNSVLLEYMSFVCDFRCSRRKPPFGKWGNDFPTLLIRSFVHQKDVHWKAYNLKVVILIKNSHNNICNAGVYLPYLIGVKSFYLLWSPTCLAASVLVWSANTERRFWMCFWDNIFSTKFPSAVLPSLLLEDLHGYRKGASGKRTFPVLAFLHTEAIE